MKTPRDKKPKVKAKKMTIKDLPSKPVRDDAVRGGFDPGNGGTLKRF
jgi:hypothetical protein